MPKFELFRSLKVSIDNVNEWLNEKFFIDVIRSHLKLEPEDYRFVSVFSERATKPGDNFLSILFRSKVVLEKNGEVQPLVYIVKAMITNEFNADVMKNTGAFPKEQKMYSDIIPAFEKLYREEAGIDFKFGPEFYYATNAPTSIIVMEDLTLHQMADKRRCLDMAQTKLALSWLAKFHAASMVHGDSVESFGDGFGSGIYTMKTESFFQPYISGLIDKFIEMLTKMPNGWKYAEKVEKWRGIMYETLCKLLEYDPNAFNVLNHGDPWSNNLMYIYDRKFHPIDLKFVDYQLCFYGSVAHDVYYFMISSWNCDIKVKRFDELIGYYHGELVFNLNMLNFAGKIPTLRDLEAELERKKFVGEIFNRFHCEVRS